MADEGQPAPMTSPDKDKSSSRETGSTWLSRRSRSVAAIATAQVVVFVGLLSYGLGADNENAIQSFTPQREVGIEQVVSTDSGTIARFVDGGVVVIPKQGPVTMDEGASAADIQRINENVKMKSEELRQQVQAGEISSEQAEEVLAGYIERELEPVTGSNPTENQNEIIAESSKELLNSNTAAISATMEELISAYLGGEGSGAQPGPSTTIETPSP